MRLGAGWADELIRQKQRLEKDLVARQLGLALTCILFAFRLPIWLVLTVYVVCVVSEFVDNVAFRAFRETPELRCYAVIVVNSFVAFLLFSLLGVLIWLTGDKLVQVAGVLSLVGALINVSTARAIHLPLGLACGIPPAVALLFIAGTGWDDASGFGSSSMAMVAAIGLIGYFGSALYQNHLANSDLARALVHAQAASIAKSRFLSDMNHEMRTPLNAILGLAQDLRASTAFPSAGQTAAQIEDGARRLQRLVEDVLDLAEAEEGALTSRPATVILRREMSDLAALLTVNSPDNRTVLAPVLSKDLPELARFDAALLRKCVLRVVARLAAALPRDQAVSLAVSCERTSHPDSDLRIMLAMVLPGGSIAAPGREAEQNTQSGRALSRELTDRIVNLLGARVSFGEVAGSALGAVITLPVKWVSDLPDPVTVAANRRLSALVVDDIATNRFVLAKLLRLLEIDTVEAEGGALALDALGRQPFDIVLLDMNMPTMNGEETFRTIRSSGSAWSTVPVIALTADTLAEKKAQYLALGIDGFVPKPVDKRLLWAEIVATLRIGA